MKRGVRRNIALFAAIQRKPCRVAYLVSQKTPEEVKTDELVKVFNEVKE